MLTLNFDTYAAWFIAREIESASNFPNIFSDSIDIWEESTGRTREEDEFWEDLADSLIRDAQDDMVVNAESLIMLTDRAAEFDEDMGEDGTQLEDDISGWHDDERLVVLLGKAYRRQYEFQIAIMNQASQRREMQADPGNMG